MDDLKATALKMLRNRAERLLRLLDLNEKEGGHLDLILAKEAGLIFDAACALDPQSAGEYLSKRLQELTCRTQGFCVNCHKHIGHNADREYCTECLAEMKAECERHGDTWPEDN